MLKKILAFVLMLYAAVAFAAVDANKGTAAELDGVKGIGPAISGKIIEERKKAPFKDWDDLITRVKGIGEKSAAKLSEGGLTVNGAAYKGIAEAAPAKKEEKAAAKTEKAAPAPAAKADEKKTAASAPAMKEDKKDAKAEAKAKKEAEKKAKEEEKAKKAEEKKAKKEAAKEKKAEAAKPAASAASAKK